MMSLLGGRYNFREEVCGKRTSLLYDENSFFYRICLGRQNPLKALKHGVNTFVVVIVWLY
jgi:hypothetical protein